MPYYSNYGTKQDYPEYQQNPYGDSVNGKRGSQTSRSLRNAAIQQPRRESSDPLGTFMQTAMEWSQRLTGQPWGQGGTQRPMYPYAQPRSRPPYYLTPQKPDEPEQPVFSTPPSPSLPSIPPQPWSAYKRAIAPDRPPPDQRPITPNRPPPDIRQRPRPVAQRPRYVAPIPPPLPAGPPNQPPDRPVQPDEPIGVPPPPMPFPQRPELGGGLPHPLMRPDFGLPGSPGGTEQYMQSIEDAIRKSYGYGREQDMRQISHNAALTNAQAGGGYLDVVGDYLAQSRAAESADVANKRFGAMEGQEGRRLQDALGRLGLYGDVYGTNQRYAGDVMANQLGQQGILGDLYGADTRLFSDLYGYNQQLQGDLLDYNLGVQDIGKDIYGIDTANFQALLPFLIGMFPEGQFEQFFGPQRPRGPIFDPGTGGSGFDAIFNLLPFLF